MDLWIRSQDKTMLCKPQYIELQGADEIAMGDINIGYRCVAKYKTKERALEVLDEIQKILKPVIFVRQGDEEHTLLGARQSGVTSKLETEFKELSTYVYEMPKE